MNDNIKYLTISTKNQITLNKDIREKLGASAGDKVFFEDCDKGLLIKKATNINECPVCDGLGTVNNETCLFCNGQKFLNDDLNSKYLIKNLVNIFVKKDVDIDIRKSNDYDYIISKQTDSSVDVYRNKVQYAILVNKLKQLSQTGEPLDINTIENYSILFDDSQYKDMISKKFNDIQLDIIKGILNKNQLIRESQYNYFIKSFSPEYQPKISKFLMPFVNLTLKLDELDEDLKNFKNSRQ